MVGIGGRPILWHIMKVYASFGEIDIVKSYLLNDRSDASDLSVHIGMGTIWLEALSSKSRNFGTASRSVVRGTIGTN
jgi:glucose-1-phosphate cytidylyltransferase